MSEEKNNTITEEELIQFAKRRSLDGGVESIEELAKKFYRPKKISPQMLNTWLNNPYGNVDNLQDLSQKMMLSNGILKEFINYKSLILTNDHYVYPSDSYKYKDKDSILKDELRVAEYLDKFGVKNLIRWITKRIYQNGEVYIYKRESKNGILIQEIPSKICKIIMLDENNIYRYAIDMSKIDDKDVNFYPEEIKKAYKKYKNSGKKKNDKSFVGNYYIVSNLGSAFQLNQWDDKGLPYFLHLFPALLNLSDAQDIDNLNNAIDNYKILHQKVLTDKNGKVLMGKGLLDLYHQALKNNAPDGVAVVTSPLDIRPIALGDGKLKNYEYVNNLKTGIYDNAGIASELFNGNAKTKESTILSSIVDFLVPLEIQSCVQNYLNFELSQKFKRGKWKVQFVPTTYSNRQTEIKIERENLTLYGSKKKYLAVLGFTPLEALNIIHAENLLALETEMKPMQTAHTLSGKGRPTSDAETNVEDESNEGTQENREEVGENE